MNINFKIFFQTLFFLLIQISLGTCITKPAVVEPKIVTKVEVKYEYKYVPVLKKHPSESNIKESIHRFYKETIPSLKEKKIALVTNPSGIGRDPFTLKDTLQKHSVHLSFLLALEHGILGLEEDFSNKVQTQDKILEVPAYHVYRLKRKQLQALLKEVDAVVFDVQGMGIRCYTYLTVLKRIMDVLSEKTELIVLDHIPPGLSLGIRGDTLEKPYKNFAAEFPLPFITGLSIGEAALYYNHEFLASRVKLKVLKVENYKRNIPYEASGLPWYTPSPNLPGLESARNYYSLVLLEGTNLSVGRGTQAPFIYFGAP
ncbi:MAG: DUF1343 domain-containing protein, partial [Leptospiraceae bacterium]|nr:DUF1343 domain-containing protein [Leptospiraceae bacterium]